MIRKYIMILTGGNIMNCYTIITGASCGIGYELAGLFARDNKNLIIVARNEAKLEEIKMDFEKKYDISVIPLALDLTIENDVDYLYEYVEKSNIIVDNLINNAGVGTFGEFTKVETDKDLDMIMLNVYALTKLMKLFLPDMVKRNRGGILNVASTAAFGVGPIMSVYYATKSYVLSLTESIREELLGTNVKISALCPGPVETEFQKRAGVKKAGIAKGYMMNAEDVARYGYREYHKGKAVIIPGIKNKVLVNSFRFIPRNIIGKISYKLNKN